MLKLEKNEIGTYGYPKKHLFLLQNDYNEARVTKSCSPYQIGW